MAFLVICPGIIVIGIGKFDARDPVNCDSNGPGFMLSVAAANTRSDMEPSSFIKSIISVVGCPNPYN